MPRLLRHPVYWALTLLVICGGCPFNSGTNSPGENIPSGGSTSGNNTSNNNNSGTTNPQDDFENQLNEDFPDCLVASNEDDLRDEILRLVNVERERAGLSTVTHNQTLENQATQYACEMIHYNFFDHVNPATNSHLDDRADEFGYDFLMIGENLAAGQSTPAQAMSDWMASPGHRENILNPNFTELGVGVRTGGEYHTYWVQEFGKPAGG